MATVALQPDSMLLPHQHNFYNYYGHCGIKPLFNIVLMHLFFFVIYGETNFSFEKEKNDLSTFSDKYSNANSQIDIN
ncbi:CLUMA_CG001641, isoform A [Clunio marinus]|uniref:CLUMA_CG001641, isoform A n=1 Tax=Clunio marinus TaxID=568069 RepID=A0A1J1HN11_9DIPT|nr:CLUMA_CG001641, isoform A [Clunio marinus]